MLPLTEGLARLQPLFLVVDDNCDFADSLVCLLESLGCKAVAAYDGPKLLDLVDMLRPEAVLVDLCMPGMTGFETCRALRALPFGAETTIVAVTGSMADQETAITDAGFDGVFAKPAEIASLRGLIAWTRRRRSASSGVTPSTQHLPRISETS
jgi:CheY-like chemotaxis protein